MVYSAAINGFLSRYGVEKAVEKMQEAGFSALGVDLNLRKELCEESDGELAARLRSIAPIAKTFGMPVGQTHAGFFFHTDCYDREYLRRHVELKKEEILLTADLECPYLVVHPLFFTNWKRNDEPERSKATNVEILRELCEFAKGYGVKIALENMPGFRESRLACSCARDVWEHVQEVGSDNLCVCLDFGHANFSVRQKVDETESSVCDYVRLFGEKIECVHIHDNTGKGDEHVLPLSPARGGIDWTEAMRALKAAGYRGHFYAETGFEGNYPEPIFLQCEKITAQVLRLLAKDFA